MNGRGLLAGVILAAWGAGIAVFAQRETSRSPRERLAEAGARVAPGATYFAVEREGRHVGFASSTIDTIPGGLQVTDYLVADLGGVTSASRTTAQSVVRLSRGLALRDFTLTFGTGGSGTTTRGRTVGDSILEVVAGDARAAASTPAAGASVSTRSPSKVQRLRLTGPLLSPTLVPVAFALGSTPEVGARYRADVYDPTAGAVRALALTMRAESSFVVVDSAAFDPDTRRWLGAHADTVRAWQVAGDSSAVIDAWVDNLGRIVSARLPGGLTIRRTAYEVAFENWRATSPSAPARATHTTQGNVVSATLVEARVALPAVALDSLTVRMRGMELSRFALNGGAQRLSGDTVTIVRDDKRALQPSFPLPPGAGTRAQFSRELRAEPFVEVDHPSVVRLARRLRMGDGAPDIVARRIMQWVHDSVAREPNAGLPSALATLRSRSGDADGLALTFVALARAAGLPARAVSGVIRVDGTFYYHAWGEVFLQRWIPVDPVAGQFPADASHLRLLVGGVGLRADFTRVLEGLTIEPVASLTASRLSPPR